MDVQAGSEHIYIYYLEISSSEHGWQVRCILPTTHPLPTWNRHDAELECMYDIGRSCLGLHAHASTCSGRWSVCLSAHQPMWETWKNRSPDLRSRMLYSTAEYGYRSCGSILYVHSHIQDITASHGTLAARHRISLRGGADPTNSNGQTTGSISDTRESILRWR